MTIIVFLLDTSASMNQRVFLGGRPTLLDVAKSAVETFVKVRQRSMDSRGDRYMLLTFEEPPINIKAGWKENLTTFMSELKNLQANGLTTLGQALRHTFDTLNINRMQHGIDTYGQGRCPFYLEPSIIVAITDGGQLSSNSGVQEELKMHGSSPGCELTREPFRWDQRLFSLVLRMSGQPSGDRETGLVPSDVSPIDAMCEVTGGRSYCITSHRMLHQCIDSLVQKVQAGVVIHFEKFGNDPPPVLMTADGVKLDESELDIEDKNGVIKLGWHNSRKMIYVPRSNQKGGFAGGFWPIPESFWPDVSLPTLPARSAHPNVKFVCTPHEPLVIENFPFDKYELEPSPLTQYILARKQPTVCWQVFMANSSKNIQMGHPFGYLKASTNLTCVNLFVMPYNYPVLLPLLDDLFRISRLRPHNEWKNQFGMYLANMPPYYAGPLKRALIRMGATNIAQTIIEENYLSYSVLNYLKKIKNQAKTEYDRTCNEVGIRAKLSEPKRNVTSFKNPFDVPRHQLLDHLARLRSHFLKPSQIPIVQQDLLHNMPVGQMGNYQEYLKKVATPLREIESTPVRQHMFGNPFKIDKRMIIDEADIDLLGQGAKSKKDPNQNQNNATPPASPIPPQIPGSSAPIIRGLKRKSGPLPKDYTFTPRKHRLPNIPDLGRDSNSDDSYSSASSPASSVSDYEPYEKVESPIVPCKEEPMDIGEFVIPPISSAPEVSPEELSISAVKTEPLPCKTEAPVDSNIKDQYSASDAVVIIRDVPEIPSKIVTVNEENVIPVVENGNGIMVNGNASEMENHSVNSYSGYGGLSMSNHINDYEECRMLNNYPMHNNVTPNHFDDNEDIKKVVHESVPTTKEPNGAEVHNNNVPDPVDDEAVRLNNIQLRAELHKEIRRPILRVDLLLDQLSSVAGSYETKLRFVRALEKEALRFKRKRLAKILDEQAQRLSTSTHS